MMKSIISLALLSVGFLGLTNCASVSRISGNDPRPSRMTAGANATNKRGTTAAEVYGLLKDYVNDFSGNAGYLGDMYGINIQNLHIEGDDLVFSVTRSPDAPNTPWGRCFNPEGVISWPPGKALSFRIPTSNLVLAENKDGLGNPETFIYLTSKDKSDKRIFYFATNYYAGKPRLYSISSEGESGGFICTYGGK